MTVPDMTEKDNSVRRRPRLLLEIAAVITCKLLFIFCLWYFFFSPSHRPEVTPQTMDSVIFGEAAQTTPAKLSR